ncbi:MAG: galactokinase [Oryzihumus sp.]
MSLCTDVAATFASRLGLSADGVWSAPGRVNLIGEHTDYNAGLCLPIALPQRTYVAARRRLDRRLRLWSGQADEPVDVQLDEVAPGHPGGWGSYVAGVLWALEEVGHPVGGLDLVVDSEVPVGAGLSSSAALECAVASAVADLFELDLTADDGGRAALTAVCVNAENTIAQAPTGGMDQAAAMRSREGHALLLDCRDGSVEHVPFEPETRGLALLVVDTRAEHSLVDGQYAERRASCEQAARELGVASLREVPAEQLQEALTRLDDPVVRARTRHVVSEIARVEQSVEALRRWRIRELGEIFDASHASMRDDFEISCPELDLAVDTARAHGAVGARMTGGGFGGSAIALVPWGDEDEVGEAVVEAFEDAGFRTPRYFAVDASGPAGRDA